MGIQVKKKVAGIVTKPTVEAVNAAPAPVKKIQKNTAEVAKDVDAVIPASPKVEAATTSIPATEVKQAIATISKNYKDGSSEDTTEQVGEPTQFSGPTANVGVSLGMTKNLGDYNNIKFQVSLHIPCLATAEEIENAYEEAKNWVDSKVAAIDAEITEQLGH